MATQFEHISIAAVKVLAQLAADAYLAAHPELVAQAQERIAQHPEKWPPKRALQTCSVHK
jgi:hypothetical protein